MTDTLGRLNSALEGRYRIERELGAGGMATVYVAEDLKHHRQVALKVLRPDLAASLGAERFLREIEIAARLSHPHILPLYDSGGADDVLFYVMPLVEGESLRDRLARAGALSIEEAVRVIREVADALAYSHQHAVVHRDIKPENILLSGSHALVTDFGVAKALSDSVASSSLTGTGVSLGTAAYMSPEQATADPATNHRADIYALGVTAYEMLAGQPPFSGNAQQIMAGHLTRRPESLSALRSSVPAALESVVMRCLEKNPADRPQSADEIVRAFQTLPAGAAPAATPGAVSIPASSKPRRRVVAAFGAAAAVLVLTAAALAWFARVGRAGTLIGDQVLARNDLVLVSEFENRTEDSTLSATITDAIRVELQQSRAVQAMSQAAMWAGMARMGLEHGTALPEPRVRELAEREGAKAFVAGDIARLGNGYQITARVIATADGREALTAKATARTEDDLIGAVEDVARQLRRGIGESLRSVLSAPALADVTTSSLPALRALTAARRLHNESKFAEAVRMADQALALDPAFASAYTLKFAAHTNLNEVSKATEAAREAYRLRERLTEIERLRIEARYAGIVDDKAAEEAAWMRLAELGQDETNYAAMLMSMGRLEDAEKMARRAVVSQPMSAIGYWNLGEIQVALHKFAAAETTAALVRERMPDNPYRYFVPLGAVWGRRDFDAIEAWLEGEEGSRVPDVIVWRCFVDLQRGRIRAWQACPSRHVFVQRHPMAHLSEFRITGDTARAKLGYESFLAAPPDERNPDSYAWTIALLSEVGRLQDARKLLDEWRSRTGPQDPGFRAESSLAVGAIAAAEGKWDAALAAFRAWHESPPAAAMTLYNRGLPEAAAIMARLGQADSAIVLYERAIGTSSAFGGGFYEPGWYAPALLTLGELYEARGDRARAAEYYRRHIDVFRDPDPMVARQVDAVRAKLAAVTGEPGAQRR